MASVRIAAFGPSPSTLPFVLGDQPAVLVYGERCGGTGLILALAAASMLANSLSITAGNGLWALERPRANFAADACTLAVTMVTVHKKTSIFDLLRPLVAAAKTFRRQELELGARLT